MLIIIVMLLVLISLVRGYKNYKNMNKFLIGSEILLNIVIITTIYCGKFDLAVSIVLSNMILSDLSAYLYSSSNVENIKFKYCLYMNKMLLITIIFYLLNKVNV